MSRPVLGIWCTVVGTVWFIAANADWPAVVLGLVLAVMLYWTFKR